MNFLKKNMGRHRLDGKHFVMIENPPGSHLEVVLNWYDELVRLVDGND
jgi:hypothetical protein